MGGRRLDRSAPHRRRHRARPHRQHRRHLGLRAAAAGAVPGRDGADPRRGDLGPGQRQGDDQRGDGLDRPRRGNRLHRGRFGRGRIGTRLPAPMGNLSSIVSNARESISDAVFEARVLHEAGILHAAASRQGGEDRRDLPPLGRLAGDRHRHRRDPPPARDRADRRARLAQLRAGPPPLQRPRPRLRRDGDRLRRRGRDHVPQPSRLRRGDPCRRQARRQRSLPQHDVRRPPARRGDEARGPRRCSSTTRSSPGCSRGSTVECHRVVGWCDGEAPGEPTLEQLIAGGDEADLKPPPDKPRFVILTSGHHRDPEGRPALQPRRAARDGGADREDPLPRPARRW